VYPQPVGIRERRETNWLHGQNFHQPPTLIAWPDALDHVIAQAHQLVGANLSHCIRLDPNRRQASAARLLAGSEELEVGETTSVANHQKSASQLPLQTKPFWELLQTLVLAIALLVVGLRVLLANGWMREFHTEWMELGCHALLMIRVRSFHSLGCFRLCRDLEEQPSAVPMDATQVGHRLLLACLAPFLETLKIPQEKLWANRPIQSTEWLQHGKEYAAALQHRQLEHCTKAQNWRLPFGDHVDSLPQRQWNQKEPISDSLHSRQPWLLR